MIRLSPTTIVLGESDLRDSTRRESQRRVEAQLNLLERLTVDAHNGQFPDIRSDKQRHPQVDSMGLRRGHPPIQQPRRSMNVGTSPTKVSIMAMPQGLECTVSQESTLPFSEDGSVENSTAGEEHDYPSVCRRSPENESYAPTVPSPEKDDDFYYGGFMESSGQSIDTSNDLTRSSFGPEDASTPQQFQPSEPRSGRFHGPLPRSPLYVSQNISMSPEPRPITGLTPRVMSRIASHNSPGIIFSVPPRRPPRTCPRFRHQTNSFSFDESERSSVAYERDDATSHSTVVSTLKADEGWTSYEELQDSLLPNSIAASIGNGDAIACEETSSAYIRTHTPQRHNADLLLSSPRLSDNSNEDYGADDTDTKSSPSLSLPPPFSSAIRRISNSKAMPGAYPASNLAKNPMLISSSPTHELEERLAIRVSRQLSRNGSPRRTAAQESPPSSRTHFPLSRSNGSRTPSPSRRSTPQSASPTPRRTDMPPRDIHTTPRDYQVYNDAASPYTQPQTPAHLPESRHRSRFHPSWTEPPNRNSRRRIGWPSRNHDGAGSEGSQYRIDVFTSPSRGARPGRSGSPDGLRGPGFQGLYGGRENGDDEQSWVDGVRSDHMETRLRDLTDSRTDERSLSNTPEREDWRSQLR